MISFYTKIRRKWHYAFNDMRGMLGMNEWMFKAGGSRIVAYHGICLSDPTRYNSIFVTLKTFEAHLKFYRKYFEVISLDDFYNQRFSKDRFNICITFDDGFANNYKYVLPLMDQYKVPATFFITGIRDAGYDILWNDFLCLAQKYGPVNVEFAGESLYKNKQEKYISARSGKSLRDLLMKDGFEKKLEMMQFFEPVIPAENKKKEEDYWLQMTRDQIRELSSSPLATIGCHGYYHNDLSGIPVEHMKEEIRRNREFLQDITGSAIDSIAFPYGNYTREAVSEVKKAGFTKILAGDFLFPEDHADRTMRDRMTMNPYISLNNQMAAIVNGKYKY